MYEFQERELLISMFKCLVIKIVETPITHGMWLDSEKGNSSTWKELTAVKQVLLSVIHILSGKRIKNCFSKTQAVQG
jgi:hypothetical protein